jgi:hypothetical protein
MLQSQHKNNFLDIYSVARTVALSTLELEMVGDRRKLAQRQRINLEKGLPLDAFDLLVQDGTIDGVGVYADTEPPEPIVLKEGDECKCPSKSS